jgi:hypothetical protein
MTRAALLGTLLCFGLIGCSAQPKKGIDFEVTKDPKDHSSGSNDDEEMPDDDDTESRETPGPVTPPREEQKPDTFVTIDNEPTHIDGITIDDIAESRTIVKIRVTGSNAPPGTEVLITLQKTTDGCVLTNPSNPQPTSQELLFFHGTYDKEYSSANGKDCGLAVQSYASKVGDVAQGSFKGTVTGTKTEAGKRHELDLAFKIERLK